VPEVAIGPFSTEPEIHLAEYIVQLIVNWTSLCARLVNLEGQTDGGLSSRHVGVEPRGEAGENAGAKTRGRAIGTSTGFPSTSA